MFPAAEVVILFLLELVSLKDDLLRNGLFLIKSHPFILLLKLLVV